MAGILVTPEQLEVAVGRVASGAAQIDDELAGARRRSGSARRRLGRRRPAALRGAVGRVAAGAATLHQALTGISGLLASAGTHYAEAEQAIAASFAAM